MYIILWQNKGRKKELKMPLIGTNSVNCPFGFRTAASNCTFCAHYDHRSNVCTMREMSGVHESVIVNTQKKG